ncbi:MAG: hypothetical protein KDB90_18005, partial [Planctomycetes bacterium]|nr:hypothetical protein [Planctomycetota bacterium]
TEADIAPHTGAPKSMSGAEFSRVEGRLRPREDGAPVRTLDLPSILQADANLDLNFVGADLDDLVGNGAGGA